MRCCRDSIPHGNKEEPNYWQGTARQTRGQPPAHRSSTGISPAQEELPACAPLPQLQGLGGSGPKEAGACPQPCLWLLAPPPADCCNDKGSVLNCCGNRARVAATRPGTHAHHTARITPELGLQQPGKNRGGLKITHNNKAQRLGLASIQVLLTTTLNRKNHKTHKRKQPLSH